MAEQPDESEVVDPSPHAASSSFAPVLALEDAPPAAPEPALQGAPEPVLQAPPDMAVFAEDRGAPLVAVPVRRRWKWLRSPLHAAGKATLRTWIVASAMVFGPAAIADVATGIGTPQPLTLVWAFGIALAMAALNGLLWSLAFAIVGRFPRFMPWVVWPAAAMGVGAGLANELGAYAKLGGKDHVLAVTALVACGVGGIVAGIVVALLQPRRQAPRGLLVRKSLWRRAIIVLILAGGGVVATVIDRRYFPGTYPGAHATLRVASLWLGMWAIVTTGARLGPAPLFRRRLISAVIYAAIALFPFVTLKASDTEATHQLLDDPLSGMLFRAAREITDVDRDGYSSVLGGGDCAPFNPWVSPGASEIPGNGIDDNCRLGDAKLVDRVASQAKLVIPSEPSPSNVVLITIDTLRADRLSLYGFSRDTTPNLLKMSRTATRFDCAITSGGWTSIAISSLMRGLYPRRLLWTQLVETSKYRLLRYPLEKDLPEDEHLRLGFALPLDDPFIPLAKFLQQRGMYTAAVTDDGYSSFLAPEFMSVGFERYVEVNPHGSGSGKGDEDTASLAIQVLNEMPKDKPFFLWVHFFGPHEPNTNHPGLPVWGKNEVDGYDQEIRFADSQVQRIVENLDKMARPITTIITSDHGEIIRNAHDRDHGSDIKPEILWVPLLVRGPAFGATKVATPVSLVDILPTVLGLTGTPVPANLDGLDLRKTMARDPASVGRFLHTDTWRMNLSGTFDVDMTAVSDGHYSLVLDRPTNDLVLRPVCDRAMSLTNLYGKVPSQPLEDALFAYDEETGGTPRLFSKPEPHRSLFQLLDPRLW